MAASACGYIRKPSFAFVEPGLQKRLFPDQEGVALANPISADLAPWLARIERPVRWLAGTTFTLYLFHLPVSRFLLALIWNPAWSRTCYLVAFLGTLATVFAVAEVTERRKEAWRRAITVLFARSTPVPPFGPLL